MTIKGQKIGKVAMKSALFVRSPPKRLKHEDRPSQKTPGFCGSCDHMFACDCGAGYANYKGK